MSQQPLKILITGAGIGGLTAALGLRQRGHDVTIFEQSRLANEYGAAISIPTNANGVLRQLGVYLEDYGAVNWNGFNEYNRSTLVNSVDQTESRSKLPHPYHMILRTDLHRALKEAATRTDGAGEPAILKTASKVRSVDADAATVTLENGEVYHGDVVIGSDGLHSKARLAVPGAADCVPFPHERSAFRMLIPADRLENDPVTAPLVAQKDRFHMFRGDQRTLIMYSGNGGKTMNIACIQPNEMVQASETGGWHQRGSKDKMMEVYKDFGESVSRLLSHADPESVGMWQLMDIPTLPRWTEGRLTLLGDAAHPFLPFLGQGGAMAIEDAGVLAGVFPAGTTASDVQERLKLYESLRYERASFIQDMTRVMGSTVVRRQAHGTMMNKFSQFTSKLYLYDAFKLADRALKGESIEEFQSLPPPMDVKSLPAVEQAA